MADKVQIVAYEGGELKVLAPGDESREAVLALPLSRLIVKVLKIPADQAGDPAAFAAPVLQSMSPYPDGHLAVSCERIRELEGGGAVVLAAALPEESADDIADALDAANLNVTRIDATVLGQMCAAMGELCPGGDDVRRLLLAGGAECVSLFVLDGAEPVAVRAVQPGGDMRRVILLSLLEAEETFGAKDIAEIVVCGEVGDESAFASIAPVRRAPLPDPAEGLSARVADAATLNALPDSWLEVLEESRFKSKLNTFLVAAGLLWALIMGVLFGVPMAYGFMTEHQKSLSKEHARAYAEVKEMSDKVNLVRKYSDHSRGALEMLKHSVDRMPLGIELKKWNFTRGEIISFTGESDTEKAIYEYKDLLDAMGVFNGGVKLGELKLLRGKTSFRMDCLFEPPEEK